MILSVPCGDRTTELVTSKDRLHQCDIYCVEGRSVGTIYSFYCIFSPIFTKLGQFIREKLQSDVANRRKCQHQKILEYDI